MSIMVLGALVGLIILVMALSGEKIARQTMIFIAVVMGAALLVIWYFLYA